MSIKARLLVGIIKEYLKSKEPIGSSFLKSSQNLSVSSATIRNYFKVLEKEGALFQPHASSGRIPTHTSLHSYWRNVLSAMLKTSLSTSRSSLENLSRRYGLYCVTMPFCDNSLEEIIISGEYVILRFSRLESVIRYSEKVASFLKTLEGMSIKDIIKITTQVGLNDLCRRLISLSEMDFERSSGRFGGTFIKDILYENDSVFLEVFHARALFKYENGIYFNAFVPQGYMALIHDIDYDGYPARMMCVGDLTCDYEGFYTELKHNFV